MIDKDKYINYLIKESCVLIEKINKAIDYLKQEAFLDYEQIKELLEILGDNEDD